MIRLANAYALTRWDSVNLKEDTIAVNYVEMPDENMPANEWFLTRDTIQYTEAGLPDTLHLIFFGGKNADPEKMEIPPGWMISAFIMPTRPLRPLGSCISI